MLIWTCSLVQSQTLHILLSISYKAVTNSTNYDWCLQALRFKPDLVFSAVFVDCNCDRVLIDDLLIRWPAVAAADRYSTMKAVCVRVCVCVMWRTIVMKWCGWPACIAVGWLYAVAMPQGKLTLYRRNCVVGRSAHSDTSETLVLSQVELPCNTRSSAWSARSSDCSCDAAAAVAAAAGPPARQ